MKRGPDTERLFWRAPMFLGAAAVVFIAPAILLRASPAWERQKFLDKKGFFLISELNPYVELSGRWWGFKDNGRRTLLRNEGEIELSAPLESGDRILLKLTPLSGELVGARLEIKAGGIEIGNAPVAPGLHYLDFPVGEYGRGGKKLTIWFAGSPVPSPSAVFHEGRVILKESRDLPFGKIDAPSEGSMRAADYITANLQSMRGHAAAAV